MLMLDANIARFHFECAELAPEVFHVAQFTGVEGISKLYRFEIDLFSEDPAIDFQRIVAHPATLTMMRGTLPVFIHGEVTDFQQLGRTRDHVAYRVVLMPTPPA